VNSPALLAGVKVVFRGQARKEDGAVATKLATVTCNLHSLVAAAGAERREWGGGGGRAGAGETGVSYQLSVLWFLAITNRLLLIPTYMEGRPILLRRRYTSTRNHRRKDTDGAFRGALNHAKNVRVKRRLAADERRHPRKQHSVGGTEVTGNKIIPSTTTGARQRESEKRGSRGAG